MTLSTTLALFSAMVLLALLPGPGILVVVARTLSQGLAAGVVTSAGIVAGDFVFIALAIGGLSALAQILGDFFLIVRYAGALYLIYLGVKTIRSRSQGWGDKPVTPSRHSTNFVAGLLTTLANPKAILFYVSFFPTFFDLSTLSYIDLSLILLVTAIAVGGVMVSYAYVANRTGGLIKGSRSSGWLKWGSGTVLIGSGTYIAVRA